MRYLFLILIVVISRFGYCQTDFSGLWQGLIVQTGTTIDAGFPLYLNIDLKKSKEDAKSREEAYNSELYALKKVKIEINGNTLNFKQINIEKKKSSSKVTWCLLNAELVYNDSTGYLEGKYTSSDCKKAIGKIVLYRTSGLQFSEKETVIQTHNWVDKFRIDYKKGCLAPEIQEKERKNFIFQPVYFDYDKAEIKPEYFDYLKKMIRVVNSHSDLRIKVVGNTDSDGSDSYNIDLSKRRAQAITNFFVENGLKEDRLKIEFNGEKNPIDTNNTPEGKQRNRRVEFSFI